MVISVKEVMESGHFYGQRDLPPEPLQVLSMNLVHFHSVLLVSVMNVRQAAAVRKDACVSDRL